MTRALLILPLIAVLVVAFFISVMAAIEQGSGYWLLISAVEAAGTVALGRAVVG